MYALDSLARLRWGLPSCASSIPPPPPLSPLPTPQLRLLPGLRPQTRQRDSVEGQQTPLFLHCLLKVLGKGHEVYSMIKAARSDLPHQLSSHISTLSGQVQHVDKPSCGHLSPVQDSLSWPGRDQDFKQNRHSRHMEKVINAKRHSLLNTMSMPASTSILGNNASSAKITSM